MIINGEEVKEKLLAGINLVANTVQPTLGPQAKTVILQGEPPIIINDGVTIAKYVSDKDPYIQMGVQMVQNLSSKAQELNGDGTTTSCIIARALCEAIHKQDIYNLHTLRKEIEEAQECVLAGLEELAKPVNDDDIFDIATIAANNDAYLGKLIWQALNSVGRDGIITVEESPNYKTNLIVREGLEIDEGFLSHLMANGEDGKATYANPLIFTSNLNIRNFNMILPMLEYASSENRPLIIFCKGMEGSAMNNVVMNLLQKTVQVCVITAPNFGDAQIDELGDIVATVGGRLFTDESNDEPERITPTEFGTCDRIIVSKEKTTIVGGTGDVSERIAMLKQTFEDTEDNYVKARLKKRISILNGGVATIQIGASSQIQMRETKERLDDALNATKAALAEGVIVGGGLGLLLARKHLRLEKTGHNIVFDALDEPIRALLSNSGLNPSEETLKYTDEIGFNALTGKFSNLLEGGVIDPVKVVKGSFNCAISIALLFLTTDVAVLVEE